MVAGSHPHSVSYTFHANDAEDRKVLNSMLDGMFIQANGFILNKDNKTIGQYSTFNAHDQLHQLLVIYKP